MKPDLLIRFNMAYENIPESGPRSVGTLTIEPDQKSVYSHSFGMLRDKSPYIDHWKGVDIRPNLKALYNRGVHKALTTTTGGAGTAGNAMIQVFLDPRIVDITRKETPLVELIPRVTNQGMTADFNRLTVKGSAITAAEDGPLDEANDTYARVSKAIKFLYAVGRVTGPSQAAQSSFILQGTLATGTGLTENPFSSVDAPNARQLEVVVKARALREKEEDLIINGDSSSDSTEFDGIVVQQGTTNVVDLSSAALTWDDIETAVRNAFDKGGRPKIAIASSSVIQDIRTIMIDTFKFGPADMRNGAELPFGISANLALQTMIGTIPVIPSRFLSNTSGSKQIFFLDTDQIEMRVLLDMTFQDLAITNDSQKFMLKIYETLVLRAPEFNGFIDNIA
jgi:hypothetical protein